MRLLYCCTHPTLRTIDIQSFLSGGFEVIPSFSHIQFKGRYRVDPKNSDNPLTEINRLWKERCTIPEEDQVKIRLVDLYRVSEEPYTINTHPSRVEDKEFRFSGMVSAEEAELLNKYVDVIVVQSFPNVVPNIFRWFKGIVVFRVFGNENPEFSVWTWYKNHLYSKDSVEFALNADRYISLPVFQGIIDTEKREILGLQPHLLYAAVFETIKLQVGGLTWKAERSKAKVVTNISYLDISPSWRKYYEEFKEAFGQIPFDVYGKNIISEEYCKNDKRIQPQINDTHEYFSKYCDYRVFCNVGKIIQHSQYTPFECAAMGVPVLFLSSSAIANEALRVYSKEELSSMGLCDNLSDMAKMAQKCLENYEFAAAISEKQKTLFYKVFGAQVVSNQAKEFLKLCEKLLVNLKNGPSVRDLLDTPSKNREKRILWAFHHKANRFEEIPLWIKAGFEVIPVKMPPHLARYQGESYDNELDPMYPDWRSTCTLPVEIIEVIREITLSQENEFAAGRISAREVDWLNKHIGYIYTPVPLSISINLLQAGYKGIILARYFGHYRIGATLANMSRYIPYNALRFYPNYVWLPAMRVLSRGEPRAIARKSKTHLVSYLFRSKDYFQKFKWSPDLENPEVAGVISSIHTELRHYYSNFVKYFGHLPYKIYGKNWKEDLDRAGIVDSGVVGVLETEEALYANISKARVYVEAGLVIHHSNYTAVESLIMGVPTVFWRYSGIGEELSYKFDKNFLKSRGMCETWTEMACLVERCLMDLDFARRLSEQQREIVGFVSQEEVISQMQALLPLAKKINWKTTILSFWPIDFIRYHTVNFMWWYNKWYKYLTTIRIVSLVKKAAYVILVLAGLKADHRGIREKFIRFKHKVSMYLR